MPRTQKLLIACALTAALAAPATADAAPSGAYGDYSHDGSINACSYSTSQLQGAIGSVPTDIAQYDPGQDVQLEIHRGGATKTVTVTLSAAINLSASLLEQNPVSLMNLFRLISSLSSIMITNYCFFFKCKVPHAFVLSVNYFDIREIIFVCHHAGIL